MTNKYLNHSDFCGWHEDQRDSDCTCGHVQGLDIGSRPRATEHADNCDWHVDQYDFECTCGSVKDPEAKRPKWIAAA